MPEGESLETESNNTESVLAKTAESTAPERRPVFGHYHEPISERGRYYQKKYRKLNPYDQNELYDAICSEGIGW